MKKMTMTIAALIATAFIVTAHAATTTIPVGPALLALTGHAVQTDNALSNLNHAVYLTGVAVSNLNNAISDAGDAQVITYTALTNAVATIGAINIAVGQIEELLGGFATTNYVNDAVASKADKSTTIKINGVTKTLGADMDFTVEVPSRVDSAKKLVSDDGIRSVTFSDGIDGKAVVTFPVDAPAYLTIFVTWEGGGTVPAGMSAYEDAKFNLISRTLNPDWEPGSPWSDEYLKDTYSHPTLGTIEVEFEAGVSFLNYLEDGDNWGFGPAMSATEGEWSGDLVDTSTEEYEKAGTAVFVYHPPALTTSQNELVYMPNGAKLFSDGVNLIFVNKNNVTNNITGNAP